MRGFMVQFRLCCNCLIETSRTSMRCRWAGNFGVVLSHQLAFGHLSCYWQGHTAFKSTGRGFAHSVLKIP